MLWLSVLLAASGCSGGSSMQPETAAPAKPPAAETRPETAGPSAASAPDDKPAATPAAPEASQAPEATAECFMESVEKVDRPRVVVHKAQRVLELYDGDALVARMPAALGSEPVGAKRREGDGRTPEGVYYACVRNDRSKYHLAIGLSYPGIGDAERGLDEGIIDPDQYRSIVDAILGGKRPPWDTPLGGEIMIHGGGADADWTAGCIALDDDCMEYLWKFVPNGTEVEIKP